MFAMLTNLFVFWKIGSYNYKEEEKNLTKKYSHSFNIKET